MLFSTCFFCCRYSSVVALDPPKMAFTVCKLIRNYCLGLISISIEKKLCIINIIWPSSLFTFSRIVLINKSKNAWTWQKRILQKSGNCLVLILIFRTFYFSTQIVIKITTQKCISSTLVINFKQLPLTSPQTCFSCSCNFLIFASDLRMSSLWLAFEAFSASRVFFSCANISRSVWILEYSISRRLSCCKVR